MRTATVNGRTGIIVAQNGGMSGPTTRVFVLFDDNRPTESDAAWFNVHAVLPTGRVAVTF